MKTKWIVIVLASLVLAITAPSRAEDGTQQLTILHSNDVHGHLRPFSYPLNPSMRVGSVSDGSMQNPSILTAFDLPARREIGGISRRATLAANIRKDLAKRGIPVWFVDAGDIFHYSPFSKEYHGDADVLAMNAAGYDMAGLGNHEFDVTTEQLRKLIADARFDFLCANVTDKATGQPITPKRYEVRQVGDVRVGVFGLVTDVTNSMAAKDNMVCAESLTVAPSVVAELRGAQKADIVILISHNGDSVDRELASQVPGIDVIISAHSHHRLTQGELVKWSDELKSDEVNGTVIVQAGQWGGELGRLDLLLKKNTAGQWRVNRYHASLLPVTSDIANDPGVDAVLDKLWAPFAAKYDEVLGTATADFAERGDDLPQNNLYADSVRSALGVDVEFERQGGSFWPIVSGAITRAALIDLDQATATTVSTFRMKGSEIRKYVLKSTPVPSGLRYRMYHGTLAAITVGDAPLDDEHVYTCAASTAAVNHMSDYDVLDKTDTNKLWSEVIMDAIRKARTITPAYDGRRVVVAAPRAPRATTRQSEK